MVSLDVHTTAHAVRQTLRLLEDLLQHEVWITALLDLSEVDIHGLHLQFLLLTEDAEHMQVLSATDLSDVAVLQIHHLVGIFHDWTGIGTQEKLILANTHHQRTLLTGRDNLVRVALVDHSDGIGADHLIEGHLYGRQQIQMLMFLDILDELHQHLGVCIAYELHALGLELLLQVGVVLDDTIMDDRQILR